MVFVDIIFIAILGGFGLFGLWFGLVHTLGSLLGTVLGVYLASRYYELAAEWLISTTGWGDNVAKVIVFIIAFLLINRLVGAAFWLVQKFTSIFTKLPFIRGFDRLLGLLFGIFEGVVTIGVILYFIDRFPLSDTFMGYIEGSVIAPYTVDVAGILVPLIPKAVRLLNTTVDHVESFVL